MWPGDVVDEWRTRGFAILPGFLSTEELSPALGALATMFPTPEGFHDGTDERRARYVDDEFDGIDAFPFTSTEFSMLAVHPRIVELAETLLGQTDLRLSSAEAWAKYTGATSYDQELHRDYLNQTVLVPSTDDRHQHLELFVFLVDVPEELGPPHLVPYDRTADLPMNPNFYPRSGGSGSPPRNTPPARTLRLPGTRPSVLDRRDPHRHHPALPEARHHTLANRDTAISTSRARRRGNAMDWKDLPLTECLRGDEAEMLQFALDRVRRQFAWKTGGLDGEQLRRRHPPSTMTLAGLIKHMAFVEDGFTATAADQPLGPPWDVRDWVGNDEWGWESAVTDDPQELYGLWYGSVERSRAAWAAMSADAGLDVMVDQGDPEWVKNRRRILIDLLEEYLKHTGHADVLREAVDGLRGNDPD